MAQALMTLSVSAVLLMIAGTVALAMPPGRYKVLAIMVSVVCISTVVAAIKTF